MSRWFRRLIPRLETTEEKKRRRREEAAALREKLKKNRLSCLGKGSTDELEKLGD